jgi:hypothetical protein
MVFVSSSNSGSGDGSVVLQHHPRLRDFRFGDIERTDSELPRLNRFIDIERTDSGVGSETSKTSKASVEIRRAGNNFSVTIVLQLIFSITDSNEVHTYMILYIRGSLIHWKLLNVITDNVIIRLMRSICLRLNKSQVKSIRYFVSGRFWLLLSIG